MTLQTMYPAIANSPVTQLANAIDDTVTSIEVVDGSRLPDAPNLATIGRGENPETILYTKKNGNVLSGITRGFQGTAQNWQAGTQVARLFTAHDFEVFRENILELKSEHDDLQGNLESHLAETVMQEGGVHGLEVEVGEWTPKIVGLSVSGEHVYEWQIGRYTRIGNIVYISCSVCIDTKDNNMSGSLILTGIPFRPMSTSNLKWGMSVGRIENLGLPTNVYQFFIEVLQNNTNVFIRGIRENATVFLYQSEHVSDGTQISFSGFYEI